MCRLITDDDGCDGEPRGRATLRLLQTRLDRGGHRAVLLRQGTGGRGESLWEGHGERQDTEGRCEGLWEVHVGRQGTGGKKVRACERGMGNGKVQRDGARACGRDTGMRKGKVGRGPDGTEQTGPTTVSGFVRVCKSSWLDCPGASFMNRRRLCQLTAAILTSDLTTHIMWVL